MKRDCASIKNHGEQHLSVTTPIETIDRVSPRWRRFALAFRRIFWTVDLDYRVVHVAQFAFLKGLSVHVSQETSRRDVSYFFCILAKLCRWIFCCKHCCISLWWKLDVALDEFIIIRIYFYAHNFTRNGIFRKTYTDIHLLKSNQVRRYIEQAS